MKSNEMDLVKIEWIDAMSDDNTWQDLKELKEQKLRPVEFVGWILHQDQDTKTFSCADDHPIVYYTFDNKVDSTDKTDKGYVICEYCSQRFKYEEKKDDKAWVNSVLKGSG